MRKQNSNTHNKDGRMIWSGKSGTGPDVKQSRKSRG